MSPSFGELMKSVLGIYYLAAFVVTSASTQSPDLQASERCASFFMTQTAPPPDAIDTCLAAAQQGSPGAEYGLALLLLRQNSPAEAIQWLNKALQTGHPGAALVLATIHLSSRQPESVQRGRELFRIGFCSGHPEAPSLAKRLNINTAEIDCASYKRFDLSGSWSGKLHRSTQEPGPATSPSELRVVLSGNTAKVFIDTPSGWNEVKPGGFTVSQIHDSAVISSLDAGWDLDGEWVESWTIHLHRLGDSEAIMSLLRSVNNVYLPAESKWKTFTSLFEGRATRTTK
jgi:hypothetical protein